MRYYFLNKLSYGQCGETPVLLKVPKKFYQLINNCIKHNNLAAKSEREAIELLAKTNNMDISEIDDFMACYDWAVDQISYGRNTPLQGEITKERYEELLKEVKNERQI